MNTRQDFSHSITADAVNVPSFFMRRVSVQSPEPSQYYHYHDCYELYYLHSGDRYYFIKDKTYHISEGSVVFIEPYAIHCTCNFEKKGYDRTVIYFRREFAESVLTTLGADFFDNYGTDCHIHKTNSEDRALIRLTIENMQAAYDSGNNCEAHLKAALVHLLFLLSGKCSSSDVPAIEYANPTHKMISDITGYINNNYSENITLADISERYYISPCYFSRTFKSLCGLSFTEYLNNVRIKAAEELLGNTDMSITDISETVGFSGSTHFDRVFKKITGVSPTAYRKNRK